MNSSGEYSVFLVDDDTMFRTSLKNKLKQKFGSKLKFSEYSTGEQCIEHIYQFHPLDEPPDIVILDYYLKDDKYPEALDGLRILKKLKAISENIVVIILSGHDKLQLAIDSTKNGAYDFITKSESSLISTENTVKNAIENVDSIRENRKYLKRNIYMIAFITSIILLDILYYYTIY